MTTNLMYFDPETDIIIDDFVKYNLKHITLVRPYKIFTIPDSDITQIISTIEPDSQLHNDIQSKLKSIFQLQS